MLYAGIDLHRKYLVVVVLDRGGAVVDERRLPNDAEVIRAYFGALSEPVQAVVEAMGSWHCCTMCSLRKEFPPRWRIRGSCGRLPQQSSRTIRWMRGCWRIYSERA